MSYDVVVSGGGIAGLTAAAFLTKAGISTVLCEKEDACGGLVNTFERQGFVYDGGIRAMENSGILFPMIKQLGLNVEFVKNHISVGIEDQVIRLDTKEDIPSYQELLNNFYPESREEIVEIFAQIQKIMHYMEIQYGIDNPVFLDMKQDREYMLKAIVPWVVKYALTVRKINALNEPVVDFLRQFTQNQSLLDIIAQHFFQETPAFFALSYLKLYLDYHYPLGGTATLIKELVNFIHQHKGTIRTNSEITAVDPEKQLVFDAKGRTLEYRRLVWAADNKTLYRLIDVDKMQDVRVKKAIQDQRVFLEDKVGNDSVLTLFLGLDLDKSYFSSRASEHFFYTPSRQGQSAIGPFPVNKDRQTIERWLERFFALTTYEISCPVMRDSTLAPPGKTGLIVSVLFDYALTKHIEDMGWYQDFKAFCEMCMLNTLDSSVYPGIKQAVLHQFSSTPLTMAKIAGNTHGAITGWSFTNHPMPATSSLTKILSSTLTPVPGIVQAGQWTYSPSGLPISILTGKLAADRVLKELKKVK